MLNIAICEAERSELEFIKSGLEKIAAEYKIEMIESCNAGDLKEIMNRQQIDVAFVNICLADMEGIELAKSMRKQFPECMIIPTIKMRKCAFESLEIHAFQYLMKPIKESDFNECMERIIRRWEEMNAYKEKQRTLKISSKGQLYQLKYDSIYCIEKVLNTDKLKVHTKDRVYECYGALSKMLNEFDEMGKWFIQCHQGYIVNWTKISEFRERDLTLEGFRMKIPVSRRLRGKIREIILMNDYQIS